MSDFEKWLTDRNDFIERFVAHMVKVAGRANFDDGFPIAAYARDTAGSYFDDPNQRKDGPEECAETDISYWE